MPDDRRTIIRYKGDLMQDVGGFQPAAAPGPIETTRLLPPIASFWQRLGASLIDTVVLGVAGQIIALVFNGILFQIGPYGRPIGLLLILPYFGILNSRLGGGQTLGKRALRIAVRDGANQPISPARSLARIAILITPAFFNGWSIPASDNPVYAWIAALAIFGLGGVLLYTMLFNWKAHQGIHDLLVGTYVVRLRGDPIAMFPKTARRHLWVSGGWAVFVGAALLVAGLLTSSLFASGTLASVMDVYRALSSDGRFFSASVLDSVSLVSGGSSSHSLVISVWIKGNPGSEERAAIVKDVVRTAFAHVPSIDSFGAIRVTATSAYDIGVASGNFSMTLTKSVDDWRQEVGRTAP